MAKTPDELRKYKREHMAKKRAENPDLMREKQKTWYHANRDERTQKMRDYAEKRFFWTKAMKLRGADRATTKEISGLWKKQKGKCALSGRRLDRRAQLDHKIPKARGGKDTVENLQWLSPEINLAKRDLTDYEFFALCHDVILHTRNKDEI